VSPKELSFREALPVASLMAVALKSPDAYLASLSPKDRAALSIYAGTAEMQRALLAAKALGL